MSSTSSTSQDAKSTASTQSNRSAPTSDQINQAQALLANIVQPSKASVGLSKLAVDTAEKFVSGKTEDINAVTQVMTRWYDVHRGFTQQAIQLTAAVMALRQWCDTDSRVRYLVQRMATLLKVETSTEKKIVDVLVRLTSCSHYDEHTASPIIMALLTDYQGAAFIQSNRACKSKLNKGSDPASKTSAYEVADVMDTLLEGFLDKCDEFLRLFKQSCFHFSEMTSMLVPAEIDNPFLIVEAITRCASSQRKHDYIHHMYNSIFAYMMMHRPPMLTRRFQNLIKRNARTFEVKAAAQAVVRKALVNLTSYPDIVLDANYMATLQSQIKETQKLARDAHILATTFASMIPNTK